MQRNFLRGLLICLVPCALFGALTVFGQYRKGIDLAGGTILVYQVDLDKAKSRGQLEQKSAATAGDGIDRLSTDQMQQLAESLKRRIDPADLRNVVIRPLGDSRIEIILPFTPSKGGDKEAVTEDFVQQVKNLVSQVGVLEFRILANSADDPEAINDATTAIKDLAADQAEKYAKAGLPPPGPTREGGYNVTINEVEVKNVVYAWNELSKEERESLGLSNKYATKPPVTKDGSSKTWLYPVLAKARAAGKNEVYLHTYSAGEKSGTAASMLLYSRECLNENITEAARKDKQIEYFVLTRISDKDAVRVAGAVSLSASGDVDPKSLTPCVNFRFNGAGADKFGDMTQRNRVSGSTIRSLAILLDDMVVSAPTLNSPIRDSGQITGNFDK
ncbi:MAG: SecDF P1 head subdomain-containing protein, partial [Gemmataceae bacterium]